jgi:hypothetical protein
MAGPLVTKRDLEVLYCLGIAYCGCASNCLGYCVSASLLGFWLLSCKLQLLRPFLRERVLLLCLRIVED